MIKPIIKSLLRALCARRSLETFERVTMQVLGIPGCFLMVCSLHGAFDPVYGALMGFVQLIIVIGWIEYVDKGKRGLLLASSLLAGILPASFDLYYQWSLADAGLLFTNVAGPPALLFGVAWAGNLPYIIQDKLS